LAWKYAKTNLDGKGGGIKTSVTQGISRETWEAHFNSLLARQSRVSNLHEIRLGGVSIPDLDASFTIEEVRAVLEQKKNHKAPGPDMLRIDFLRIF
jgi:hypothetical protein